jgi:acetolactate synthase-1/2/3 large subunit
VVAQVPQSLSHTLTHQRLAIEQFFAPISKRSATVGAEDTCELVRDCLSLAGAPRPGPVVLALPSDVANQKSNCPGGKPSRTSPSSTRATDSLGEVQNRIARSQRPLILIGVGTPVAAAPALRTLIEALQAPFLVTPKVKGILPEDHPLFLGVASGMAIDGEIVKTIRAADLIVAIGFDPVEADKTWFAEVDVVAIDNASMAGGEYLPVEVTGNLVSLIVGLTSTLTESKPWPKELLEDRAKGLKRLPRQSASGVSPLALIEELRSTFPRSGIVSCDVGSHKLMMGQFWRSYEPGTFFMSNGLSGMGYGIPAAIAAQLVYPTRAVMAVVGDGGMLMMIHDLVLIRELDLPIIIVVLVDNSLSLIRVSQERRGYPACGVDFTGPHFEAVANAFGVRGEKAASVAEVQAAVDRALDRRTSLLLEVPVDLREYYELV